MMFHHVQTLYCALVIVAALAHGFRTSVYSTSRIHQSTHGRPFQRSAKYLSFGKRNANRNAHFVTATESEEIEPEVVVQIEDLSLPQIAELIEISFIQSCMQMAQGYVDVLKLFIVSVKAAYQRSNGYNSMDNIVRMVDTCMVNTAGRPLELEEIQLRATWIYAVALMLDHVNYHNEGLTTNRMDQSFDDNEDDCIASTVASTYRPVLSKIFELKHSGNMLKTQDFMEQNKGLFREELFDDNVQLAITTQTIKVLWYTLTVLEEERLANDTDEITDISRPQIPRGEGIN